MTRHAHRFGVGERVTATLYGEPRVGTVVPNPISATGGSSSLVWVQWDGRTTRSWYHAESLSPASTAGLDEKGTSHG